MMNFFKFGNIDNTTKGLKNPKTLKYVTHNLVFQDCQLYCLTKYHTITGAIFEFFKCIQQARQGMRVVVQI